MPTKILRPNAAGDLTQVPNQFPVSGSHWDKVDEVSADDGTTYIYSSTSSTPVLDLFNLPSLVSGGLITDITVWARCKKSSSAQPFMNFVIIMKTGGNVYLSPVLILTDSWADYSKSWNDNPDTNLNWTEADIAALQIGVRIQGVSLGSIFTSCTQVYVIVTTAPFVPNVQII